MSDKLGVWLRRVFKVRQPPEGSATAPPTDMDIKRAVLHQAVTDVRRFASTWRGMLTIADEIEKLSSLMQAVEETEKRHAVLRAEEEKTKARIASLKLEVERLLTAHQEIVDSLARVRGEDEYVQEYSPGSSRLD